MTNAYSIDVLLPSIIVIVVAQTNHFVKIDNTISVDDYWYNFMVTNYNIPFISTLSPVNYYNHVEFTAVL